MMKGLTSYDEIIYNFLVEYLTILRSYYIDFNFKELLIWDGI